MRLVFAGTPEVALPTLDAIAASGYELAAVVTRPDAPSGRGRRLVRSPVGQWADEHGVAKEIAAPLVVENRQGSADVADDGGRQQRVQSDGARTPFVGAGE